MRYANAYLGMVSVGSTEKRRYSICVCVCASKLPLCHIAGMNIQVDYCTQTTERQHIRITHMYGRSRLNTKQCWYAYYIHFQSYKYICIYSIIHRYTVQITCTVPYLRYVNSHTRYDSTVVHAFCTVQCTTMGTCTQLEYNENQHLQYITSDSILNYLISAPKMR